MLELFLEILVSGTDDIVEGIEGASELFFFPFIFEAMFFAVNMLCLIRNSLVSSTLSQILGGFYDLAFHDRVSLISVLITGHFFVLYVFIFIVLLLGGLEIYSFT